MPTSTPASSVGNGDARRCPWACELGHCGCVPMEGMGAGGRGSERVHPRQNRGERMEFSLLVIGTVPGCNWSVRADGNFEVGPFMRLFAFSSVVSVGPLAWIKFPWLKPVA